MFQVLEKERKTMKKTKMKKIKEIKLTMNLTIDADSLDELKRLEHHIEELLDLDNWTEIKSVYGVEVEEIKE